MVSIGGHRWGNSGRGTLPKAIEWAEVLQLTSGENVMTQCPVLYPRFLHPSAVFILPGLDSENLK